MLTGSEGETVCVAGELGCSSLEGLLCRELKGAPALPVLLGSAAVSRSLFRAHLSLSLASPLLFLPHLSRITSAQSKVSQNS